MKRILILLITLLLLPLAALQAAELTLYSPIDYQVMQRATPARGLLRFAGTLSD
jgi:hypothetical protein